MKSEATGYRLLWMQVMFDLPVGEADQRKRATQFRNDLLDLGFTMCQFSVYMRHIKDKEQSEIYLKKLERLVPDDGSIHILVFTDRQYENMRSFKAGQRTPNRSPEQLTLF